MLKTETILDVIAESLAKAKIGELKRNSVSVLLSTGTERFIIRVRPKKAKAKKVGAKKSVAKRRAAKSPAKPVAATA